MTIYRSRHATKDRHRPFGWFIDWLRALMPGRPS